METGIRTLTETDLSVTTTTKQTQFGALGTTEDGRMFRYVSFGGTTTIVPGVLLQAAVATTNATGLTITAVGTGGQTAANLLAGSTTLVLTNGSTAVTADEFAEGFLEVVQTSGSNEGPIQYRIKGNTAAAATTGYITVFLVASEPLRNAQTLVAGTDTANLWVSPYQGAIITTTVNVPIGVTVNQVVNTSTVTNYGWVQCRGEAIALQDASSLVIGNTVGPSTTTAGYVGLAVAATKPAIGWSKVTSSTGGASAGIYLNLP
jgi:hypothetical protein